jgi:hypothetical protein
MRKQTKGNFMFVDKSAAAARCSLPKARSIFMFFSLSLVYEILNAIKFFFVAASMCL